MPSQNKCLQCGKIIIDGIKHICSNDPIYILCPICRKGYDARVGHDCPGLPRIDLPYLVEKQFVQKVIVEADIVKYVNEGWAFKVQLQSGSIIMEKAVDTEKISDTVMMQARKQIENTIANADVEAVTEKVLEQANKQITDAIAQEKQRLLKE